MAVPALDRAGVDHGKVDLAEFGEHGRIPPQHVHDLAARILDLTQRRDDDTVKHGSWRSIH
jgi:hypothetical protein